MSQTYLLAALEAVIGAGDQIKLQELWNLMLSRYGNAPDFDYTCGKSMDGFKMFLNSHTNLFCVSGDTVLLTDLNPPKNDNTVKSSVESSVMSRHTVSDFKSAFEAEAEAVKYFQDHLLKKSDRWVPIRSLAGHLSQASPRIRLIVGPQQDFANFLSSHPLIFEVQGDLVGLTNRSKNNSRSSSLRGGEKKPRPISSDNMNKFESLFSAKSACEAPNDIIFDNNNSCRKKHYGKFGFTKKLLADYADSKAILWLTYIINCKSEGNILLPALLAEVIRAPETIKRTLGRTQIELLEFLRRHNRLFTVDDFMSEIGMHELEDLHIVVVAKRTDDNNSSFLLSQRGSIYCIKKLWGIIDLGFHEHVFFDRSLFKNVIDLTKHFEVNEPVYFNAVLASKESRAKWRATCVWKETDQLASRLASLHTQSQNDPCCSDDNSDNPEDPDSGLDNSDELVNNQNQTTLLPSLFDDLKTELEFGLTQFASITIGDICDVNESQPNPGTDLLHHVPITNQLTNSRSFDERVRSSSPSSSLDSVSELNTLSGIPSICAIPDLAKDINCYSKSSHSEHVKRNRNPNSLNKTKHHHHHHHHHQQQQQHSNSPVQMHSISTQTFFTGDIMATKFYHE